jgi:predicted RNase H-like HicB family nuclease
MDQVNRSAGPRRTCGDLRPFAVKVVRLYPFPMSLAIRFCLEYWKDGDWYVGRLPQVPDVFSQGATLQELEENIRDAYRLMLEEETSPTS